MAKTGLHGPYRLTFDGVQQAVTRRAAGAYALGYTAADGKFHINHVGRSDSDLRSRLNDCIGSAAMFKFGQFASSREAFEKECELFHDFSPPGTASTPTAPPALIGIVHVAGTLVGCGEQPEHVG